MLELDDKTEFVSIFPHNPGGRRLIASSGGYGFIVPENDLLANRKAGKQVLNVDGGKAIICLPVCGDHVATVGDNGKALIFPVDELPVMPKGKGVKLQSYREGGLWDLITFDAENGAMWIDGAGRNREWPDWRGWLGKRAASGRILPKGFPVSKRFKPR